MKCPHCFYRLYYNEVLHNTVNKQTAYKQLPPGRTAPCTAAAQARREQLIRHWQTLCIVAEQRIDLTEKLINLSREAEHKEKSFGLT